MNFAVLTEQNNFLTSPLPESEGCNIIYGAKLNLTQTLLTCTDVHCFKCLLIVCNSSKWQVIGGKGKHYKRIFQLFKAVNQR